MKQVEYPTFSTLRIGVLACTLLLLLVNGHPANSQALSSGRNIAAGTESAAPTEAAGVGRPRTATVDIGSSLLRIGVGDLVEMNVFDVPELTSKTRITSDGNAYFPLIGYVHLSGLTAEQSQGLLEKKLSLYLKRPNVSFFVSEYASQGVSVLGEVAKPGIYPFRGEPRLFDLISTAGGLTEKAGHTITITHENDPDNPVSIELSRNVSDTAQSNVPLLPHDTIVVHKADLVYVVGEVGKPSALLIDRAGLTVLRAITLAGGTTRTAKLTSVKILRQEGGHLTEQPVPLKKILSAKAADPTLEADDIVVVPASAGKALVGRTLEAALQAATLVTVAAVQ